MISPETFVVVPLERAERGGMANVVVRGVSAQAFEVRKGIEIVAGRIFKSGAREVVVGLAYRAAVPQFARRADVIRFAEQDWTVVGQFAAGGSSFESEIWGENEQFMPVFRGQIFQSVTFRMKDPSAFDGVKQPLEADARLAVDAVQERDFYANQSTMLATDPQFHRDLHRLDHGGRGGVRRHQHDVRRDGVARAGNRGAADAGFKPRSVMGPSCWNRC